MQRVVGGGSQSCQQQDESSSILLFTDLVLQMTCRPCGNVEMWSCELAEHPPAASLSSCRSVFDFILCLSRPSEQVIPSVLCPQVSLPLRTHHSGVAAGAWSQRRFPEGDSAKTVKTSRFFIGNSFFFFYRLKQMLLHWVGLDAFNCADQLVCCNEHLLTNGKSAIKSMSMSISPHHTHTHTHAVNEKVTQ